MDLVDEEFLHLGFGHRRDHFTARLETARHRGLMLFEVHDWIEEA